MINRHFQFLLLVLLSSHLQGQEGYISTDSSTTSGVKLVEQSDLLNSQFCAVNKDGVIIKYSPFELKEYGSKEGRVYRSYPVRLYDEESRYFLERVIWGKVDIFYLKTRGGVEKFYIEENNGSGLIEINGNKAEFTGLLRRYVADCPQSLNNLKHLKLDKEMMKRFFSDYENCLKKPFPKFSYGFFAGLSVSSLFEGAEKSIYSLPEFRFYNNLFFGAFLDIPIFPGNITFHPELRFNSINIDASCQNTTHYYKFFIKSSSLTIPLLFRYNFLYNKISPFIEAGPLYSIALKNEGSTYRYDFNNHITLLSSSFDPILQDKKAGFSAGAGVTLNYDSSYAILLSLHYSNFLNLNLADSFLNINELTIGIGIQF
jgi:hypothetical protein